MIWPTDPGYILIGHILKDRLLMEGYAGGISLHIVELDFCHLFTFILDSI